MGTKKSRMKVETYGAVQGVKYALRARATTAIQLFQKTSPNQPVDRTMCRNIRSASAIYRRKLTLAKEEKEKQLRLMKIKKTLLSKRAAKQALDDSRKLARLRHLQQQRKKGRLRVLQELAERLKEKKTNYSKQRNV